MSGILLGSLILVLWAVVYFVIMKSGEDFWFIPAGWVYALIVSLLTYYMWGL